MTGTPRRSLRLAIGVAGGLLLAAALIGILELESLFSRPTGGEVVPAVAAASPAEPGGGSVAMSLHDRPQALPEVRFQDNAGQPLTLADFRGKLVLFNVWATWCGPCRREMPTLDRLQAKLGGPDFAVVALSIDRAGIAAVSEFYSEVGIQHLAKYVDESGGVARHLNVVGLPTTLLIDREGREIGRHMGPAKWDAPEMIAFFWRQLSLESGSLWPRGAPEPAPELVDRQIAVTSPRYARPTGLDLPVTGDPTSSAVDIGAAS